MSNDRFDALNALKVLAERNGREWSPVEEIADDLGESMSAVERLLDPCVQEKLAERRGLDRDPEYRLTRSGEMYVAESS
jgi:DNA-binding IclR family transcriptional regulator